MYSYFLLLLHCIYSILNCRIKSKNLKLRIVFVIVIINKKELEGKKKVKD